MWLSAFTNSRGEALQDMFQEHFSNMQKTFLRIVAIRHSIKCVLRAVAAVSLESPKDARAAVNKFCAQPDAGGADQA